MNDPATPAQLGYRMPAEWEPHAATWLSWPHNPETWPGSFAPIPELWADLVRTLVRFEPVHVLAGGEAVMDQAKAMVGHLPGVTLHDIPTNDAWIRDHGPIFLAGPPGSEPALVDWRYNAWGGKYPPYDLDNDVPRRIAEVTGRRRFALDAVLEGGAIDSNGRGTLLASATCLLHKNRNPQLTRDQMEHLLCAYLGAQKILWVEGEIAGDDTDGHVDQLARFVGPATVVAAVEEDPRDANFEPLQANLRRLERMTDEQDRPLEIIHLPMPRSIYHEDTRLPAGYANFYIATGAVIVPQYDDPADRQALEILARFFPNRQVIPLPANALACGLGAYHCITQQEPAATR